MKLDWLPDLPYSWTVNIQPACTGLELVKLGRLRIITIANKCRHDMR